MKFKQFKLVRKLNQLIIQENQPMPYFANIFKDELKFANEFCIWLAEAVKTNEKHEQITIAKYKEILQIMNQQDIAIEKQQNIGKSFPQNKFRTAYMFWSNILISL
jgi:ribosome-binding ATPase YchF (GTP1/OBG family)